MVEKGEFFPRSALRIEEGELRIVPMMLLTELIEVFTLVKFVCIRAHAVLRIKRRL